MEFAVVRSICIFVKALLGRTDWTSSHRTRHAKNKASFVNRYRFHYLLL